jgi:phosphoglycerate dehydrogenase-like enzyme
LKHEKVFITPHIGANTVQVQEEIMGEFLEEVGKIVR